MIKRYLEYKLGGNLFDRTIAAYIARGKRIEPVRTTYNKTYKDFIRCTHLGNNIEVCFVDDLVHPQMMKNNVMYINIPPYQYLFFPSEMVERVLRSPMRDLIKDKNAFKEYTLPALSFKKAQDNHHAHIYNGNLLHNHIHQFIMR